MTTVVDASSERISCLRCHKTITRLREEERERAERAGRPAAIRDGKNIYVETGRVGGMRRAVNLSPQRRREIAMVAVAARLANSAARKAGR
jgi:hypothetical protein